MKVIRQQESIRLRHRTWEGSGMWVGQEATGGVLRGCGPVAGLEQPHRQSAVRQRAGFPELRRGHESTQIPNRLASLAAQVVPLGSGGGNDRIVGRAARRFVFGEY